MVHSCVHLNLKIIYILLQALSIGMSFRIAGTRYAKAAEFFNKCHQVGGMLKFLPGRYIRILVTTKRKYVFYTVFLKPA